MKNTKTLILIACLWMTALAAHAHPTMAGRLKSYANGILTIEQDDKSVKVFAVSDKTSCVYNGRKASLAALPKGAKISIEVIGSLGNKPLKAGKVVDWASSETIVAVGAKSPYYTAVGQYASTNGTGGVPDGAPVGNHAASHTLGAVGHGGAINAPTEANHSVGQTAPQSNNAYSSMGQPAQPTHYQNQGDSMTAPLEMMNISPYGNGQSSAAPTPNYQSNPAMTPGADPSMGGMDPSMMGMTPGMNPAMNPGADPSMAGMDPSLGMMNPYTSTNLGMGQSGNLMGMTGDEDGDYSAGGDMMGLNDGAYGTGSNKITGSILQVDMQRGFLTIQSFTSPQPQRVIMGSGSSAPPDLLVPGKMVEITGHPTANGFQALDIKAASGF